MFSGLTEAGSRPRATAGMELRSAVLQADTMFTGSATDVISNPREIEEVGAVCHDGDDDDDDDDDDDSNDDDDDVGSNNNNDNYNNDDDDNNNNENRNTSPPPPPLRYTVLYADGSKESSSAIYLL